MRLNQLALRNLMRHKRRTLITALSVAFGLLLSVTFTASGDYSYTNMINTSATMGLGHLTVEPAGYNESPTLSKRLLAVSDIRHRLLANSEVAAAYPRIMGQALFATGTKNVGGMFLAVNPAVETAEHNLFLRSLVKGALDPGADRRSVIIGQRMAAKLNLRLGKKIIFTATDRDGEIVSELGRVTGIFATGDDSTDGSVVLMSLGLARRFLRYEADSASIIAVLIKDQRRANKVRGELGWITNMPDVDLLTWEQTQADLAGLIAIDRASNYLLQFLIGLLIAAGILNTMLMSVLERTREFGMMMAIGMAPGQMMRLVLIESFWIGVLGLLLGVVLTTPWFLYMRDIGINLSRHIGDDYSAGGVLVDPVLKFRLFKESAMVIVAAIFGLTMAAGLYPAWRAGRVPPVDSLKNI